MKVFSDAGNFQNLKIEIALLKTGAEVAKEKVAHEGKVSDHNNDIIVKCWRRFHHIETVKCCMCNNAFSFVAQFSFQCRRNGSSVVVWLTQNSLISSVKVFRV